MTGMLATLAAAASCAVAQVVAVVERLQGDAKCEHDGEARPLAIGSELMRHDRLMTAEASRLALQFRDGSRLVMGESAAVTIEESRPAQGRSGSVLLLNLESGAARLTAARSKAQGQQRVELRTWAAIISGSDVFSGPVDAATGIIGLSGSVTVRNDAGSVMLDNRNTGTIVKNRDSAPERPRGFNTEQIRSALTAIDFIK